MPNAVDPTALLSFINQRKATRAMERVQNQFARGLTVDAPGRDNSPLYGDYTVEIPASAANAEVTVIDIATAKFDGLLVKEIKVTTGTNTSIEKVIIDDVEIPFSVASGSTSDAIDIKNLFGDFVYAETKISFVASNSVATAENISANVIGFKDE